MSMKLPDAISSYRDIILDTSVDTSDATVAATALQEQVRKELTAAPFQHNAAIQIAWLVTKITFLERLIIILGEDIHGPLDL